MDDIIKQRTIFIGTNIISILLLQKKKKERKHEKVLGENVDIIYGPVIQMYHTTKKDVFFYFK